MLQDTSERWLPVVGWELYYMVSDWGRVRSLPRRGIKRNRQYGGIMLRPQPINRLGHLGIHLSRNNESTFFLVHRLVTAAFIGPCPEGMQVRHLDGNPVNNALSNLAYGTPAEDHQDKLRHGTAKSQRMHCGRGHEYTTENTFLGSKGERNCRTCYKAARAAWLARQPPTGPHNKFKTHCPQGHEYTPDNTYVNPKGSRECRTCARARHSAA